LEEQRPYSVIVHIISMHALMKRSASKPSDASSDVLWRLKLHQRQCRLIDVLLLMISAGP
jgi:hypothetical protein